MHEPQEVRCESGIKFGEVVSYDPLDPTRLALKVKCRSEMCKPRPHAVVFHLFDVETFEHVDDDYLLDPVAYYTEINENFKEGATP